MRLWIRSNSNFSIAVLRAWLCWQTFCLNTSGIPFQINLFNVITIGQGGEITAMKKLESRKYVPEEVEEQARKISVNLCLKSICSFSGWISEIDRSRVLVALNRTFFWKKLYYWIQPISFVMLILLFWKSNNRTN